MDISNLVCILLNKPHYYKVGLKKIVGHQLSHPEITPLGRG